jgi:hypothetical protein
LPKVNSLVICHRFNFFYADPFVFERAVFDAVFICLVLIIYEDTASHEAAAMVPI